MIFSLGSKQFKKGIECLRRNDWDTALEYFEEAAQKLGSMNAKEKEYLLIGLGLLYGVIGEKELATKSLDTAFRLGATDGVVDEFLAGMKAHASGGLESLPTPFRIQGKRIFAQTLID